MSEFENAQDGRKKRSIVLLLLIAALIVVLSVGGTLAYLTTKTNTKSNMFISTSTITAQLTETAWDGGGSTTAQNMLPSVSAAKNPVIQNTNATGGEGEYVAARLTFQKATAVAKDGTVTWADMSQDEVNNLMVGVAIYGDGDLPTTGGISVDSGWVKENGTAPLAPKTVYYYNSKLDAQSSTSALFSKVGLLAADGNGAWSTGDTVSASNFLTWLNSTCEAGKFQIVVDGCAVQSTGIANAAAATPQFDSLLPVA
ncbi:MAG: hypothetical protein LKK57_07240 [Atopobiaceae bacterium]|nr:hypothetical protein [Atopobiaceae bacterium]MCI2208122.1 hypothetical protein [Atopobiaceae bacterium]